MALQQEWTFHPFKLQVNRPSTFRVMDVGLRGLHLGDLQQVFRCFSFWVGIISWEFGS